MSRRPYVRPMSRTTWYLRNGRYRIYMLREVTCLLVGFYAALTIIALAALAAGPDRWGDFIAAQQNRAWAAFHFIALLYFLVYQTFAWFKLAPKAMPLQLGEKKLPGSYIVAGHYVAWAAITVFVLWLAGVF